MPVENTDETLQSDLDERFKNAFEEGLKKANYNVSRDDDGFIVVQVPRRRRPTKNVKTEED